MLIHTVRAGDTIYNIAREYGTPPSKIIEYNDLKNPDKLPVGLELLIIIPTRSYTAKRGESIDEIANKFGIRKKALKRANPYFLTAQRTKDEQVLVIKQDAPKHGTILLNGQLYRGYDPKRLSLALEYAKYVTISSYKASSTGISRVFDDRAALSQIKEAGCVPIMRVYSHDMLATIKNNGENFTRDVITTAKKRGYHGIALTIGECVDSEDVCDKLMQMKKLLIDEGLVLFVESDKYTKAHDIADAVVLRYEKCHLNDIPSFILGEERHFSDYAAKADNVKAFMDISPFAFAGGDHILKKEAIELAYREREDIKFDTEALVCNFTYGSERNKKKCCFESLENIKAKLELISELGFMGMSFDITRCPIEYLIMCFAEFALCDYSSFEI